MLSIIISATSVIASQHKKTHSKQVFHIPLNIESGGLIGVAQRCKAAFRAQKIRARKTHIVLLENIIYKEFTHMPTTAKAIAGFAELEARTVLREQASSYTVSNLHLGRFKNQGGEESSLLLATPTTLLKALQAAFSTCGFKVEGIHSGFDAYKAACERTILPKMGLKGFVAIDFSLEHTLVNVYSKGCLASQRRLPGFAQSMLAFLPPEYGTTDKEKIARLRDSLPVGGMTSEVASALTSFIWDTLRTVRVVTAPLQLEIDEFFISGEAASDEELRVLIENTLEMASTFANNIDGTPILSRHSVSNLFLAGGAIFSSLDLLSQLRVAKKNSILDIVACIALTLIVAIGFASQPFAIALKKSTLESTQVRHLALSKLQGVIDERTKYSLLLNDIELRKNVLSEYTSNVGETHPRVQDLFKTNGLKIKSLSYEGNVGTYSISFTADTKEIFLRLKDKIYADSDYYLNLNISATKASEGELHECVLIFTPSSFKPIAESVVASKSATPPEQATDVEGFLNETE